MFGEGDETRDARKIMKVKGWTCREFPDSAARWAVAERFTGPNADAANRLRHRAYRGAWMV